jgi:glucose/arabinose dehydrogenase
MWPTATASSAFLQERRCESGRLPEPIVSGIPSTHHWTRTSASLDGSRLLLTVGSGSNDAGHVAKSAVPRLDRSACARCGLGTEQGRADLLSYNPDGRNEKRWQPGCLLRLAIQPISGQPWCAVNERDGLGDNTPFDYATSVKDGAFYGCLGTISADIRTPGTRVNGRTSKTW